MEKTVVFSPSGMFLDWEGCRRLAAGVSVWRRGFSVGCGGPEWWWEGEGLFFVLLADVVGVDVGLVVFETGAVLGAAVEVERGARIAFGDVLVVHRRGVETVVGVAFAGLCVARGGEEQKG